MTEEEYIKQYKEEDAPGWLAIDAALDSLYPHQEPRHYASAIKYMMGGPDPLDGASIYDSHEQTFHRHVVSYGMSELYYAPEKAGGDFNGWGFEFTFRLKSNEADEDPQWVVGLMNSLARYVFESGNWFDNYHYVPANGPIRLGYSTEMVGILFTTDPELGTIVTPHGQLTFLQMVGVTSAELERLTREGEAEKLIAEMRVNNPLLITEL
jgi:hypothetical protein